MAFKSPARVPRPIVHISYPTSFSFGKLSAKPTEKNASAEPDLPQCGHRSDAPPVGCYPCNINGVCCQVKEDLITAAHDGQSERAFVSLPCRDPETLSTVHCNEAWQQVWRARKCTSSTRCRTLLENCDSQTRCCPNFSCQSGECRPASQEDCQAAGWYWNFSTGTCEESCTYVSDESLSSDIANNSCANYVDDDCDGALDWDDPGCYYVSPVLVDVLGNGFDLTDSENGVRFDITGLNRPLQVAWTLIQSDDAWLALDRNGNGMIDNGRELFGNVTPQNPPTNGNGFRALEEYDKQANGGNGDG